MGNVMALNTTDIPDIVKAIEDDDVGVPFENQNTILQRSGDRPAVLWVAMFRSTDWQEVAGLDDDDAPNYGPFLSIQKGISNLLAAEPGLSNLFSLNGGVQELVRDLVDRLNYQKHKNVYIWTRGGSWEPEKDFPMIQALDDVFEGHVDVALEKVVRFFDLELKKKLFFRRKFIRPTEIFAAKNRRRYDYVDHWNTTALTGVSDSFRAEDKIEIEKFGW